MSISGAKNNGFLKYNRKLKSLQLKVAKSLKNGITFVEV